MQRKLETHKAGLGELTFYPETHEEIAELERVCPRQQVDGVLQGYEWKSGTELVLFARQDPNWRPPAEKPKPDGPGNPACPTPSQLADWAMADLQTRAAELGVPIKNGERKADLIAKIVPAWEKKFAEGEKSK